MMEQERHGFPVSRLRDHEKHRKALGIILEEENDLREMLRFYSNLLGDLVASEVFFVLLLAFVLSVLPFMFL